MEEDRSNRGRGMTWVAKHSGRRSSRSKAPKAGRQGPVEKHQAVMFKCGKSRETRRAFWGQSAESPNARLWSSYLIQWSAGSHWKLLSRGVAFFTAVPG